MARQHLAPGALQAQWIKAGERQQQLADIAAGTFQLAVEQQALLQRRQRVDIFHAGQCIQFDLTQTGQRHIAGRQPWRDLGTVLGDAAQLILQACDQALQGGARQLRRVEVDVQLQGTATLLGVDDQWSVHGRIGFAPQAAFAQTQAALALVELAQVVEQQLRRALGQLTLLDQ